MKHLRIVLALAFLAAPLASQAWWNEEWKFRKELSFDLTPAGADIAGTPTDVPVLVRLHIGNFTYFGDTQPDGGDLRFLAADDKTPLKFHIERYDPQSQMAFVWVSMPRLAGGSNAEKIFLYYGNPEAASASDPAGSYDKGQAAVFHFAETAAGEGAGAVPQDSSAYKNHANAAAGELYPAALIGGGLKLNGSSAVQLSPAPNLRLLPQQGATASAWVRFETAPQDAYVVALEQDGRALVLGIAGTSAYAKLTAQTGTAKATQSNGQLAAGTWHHLAVRAGEGRLTLFVDGAEAGATDVGIPEIAGTLSLGGSALGAASVAGAAAGGGHFFAGELDEFQFASVARSADWIKAAARSQGMQAPLLVYGGDTQKDSGDVSYFAITLRNVTVDGWVIIAVLMVMFVVSMVVMGGKGFYLNRVRKGNSEFLREFHKQRDDPRALDRQVTGDHQRQNKDRNIDKGKAKDEGVDEEEESAFESAGDSQYLTALFSGDRRFGASTLFPLYHHGVREMTKRLEGKAAGADRAQTLSPQSIEAIRATMDASLTRLSQKLSAQMVLLTICISGGPFLGLLGTVVGVMITFAAIAASGDVNINAIAPGTAAALAATVAGLGVAIPCLFGYNYLNTRIKEIVADMRVFVDEFVTQAAENYS